MNLKRTTTHLCTRRSSVKRYFPTLSKIEQAIADSEKQHSGQIRFAVEAALNFEQLYHQLSAQQRALEVFSQLHVWDTEHNNGVLIYLLLADRDVEIIADRGINAKLDQMIWQQICARMEQAFRNGQFEQGVLDGIASITQLLSTHFPAKQGQANELKDEAVVL